MIFFLWLQHEVASSSAAAETDARSAQDEESNVGSDEDEDDEDDSSGMNDIDLMSLDSAHVSIVASCLDSVTESILRKLQTT